MDERYISWRAGAPVTPISEGTQADSASAMHAARSGARLRRQRAARVLVALVLAIAAVAVLQRHPADAASGIAGPASVTVTPTDSLADGQAVDVTATFTAGSVFKVTVHLCKHNAAIANDADFAFDGPNCSPNKVSPNADKEQSVFVAPSDTSVALTAANSKAFHVGIGTGDPWMDFFDNTNTQTCDSTHQCDLVVEVAISGGAAFFTAPLTFAGDGPTTTGGVTTSPATTAPATTAPATTSPGTTAAPTTTHATTTSAPSTTTHATTTTSGAATTTADPSTTTSGGGSTTTRTAGTSTTSAVIAAGTSTTTSGGALPFTGANTRDLVSAAVLLMAAGLFLLAAALRRPAEP
jgi:hypothetical protein